MSTHRRKVSDSDRGSASSAPDELEVPRPCGISIPGAAYQVELRLVLQLAMIRLTLEKGAYLYGVPDQHSRNSTSHKGQREIVNLQS